jgi:hypothetical protein
MSTYTVAVEHPIAGKTLGQTLTDEDLAGLDIDSLITIGAITTNTTPTKKKDTE